MILVINEWIFEDLTGENGQGKFKEAAEFVVKLNRSDDKVVVPVELRWREKANRARTAADPMRREAGRLFVDLFWDLSKGVILNADDIPVTTEDEYDWAPPEDVYLIEAYAASSADLLVTTDVPLFEAIAEYEQFTCQMRDDFISAYGSTQLSS